MHTFNANKKTTHHQFSLYVVAFCEQSLMRLMYFDTCLNDLLCYHLELEVIFMECLMFQSSH